MKVTVTTTEHNLGELIENILDDSINLSDGKIDVMIQNLGVNNLWVTTSGESDPLNNGVRIRENESLILDSTSKNIIIKTKIVSETADNTNVRVIVN